MADQIRNITHIEFPTDVARKDGKGNMVIMPHGVLNAAEADEAQLKASLKGGALKDLIEKKRIVVGQMITGDAKKIEKVHKEEAKKIEAKIAKDKKKK
jgi:hypothetical protein